MKAALLRGIEDLVYQDRPVPEPGPGELLVKVRACAVCGTDVKIYHHGHRLIRFPRVTGHEIAGEVAGAGAGVSEFRVGDRVQLAAAVPCGECFFCRRGAPAMCDRLIAVGYHFDGGFAEYLKVPERMLRNACVNRIPDGLPFEEAALAEPLACVINGQERSGIGFGSTVLVLGAGPIGCFHAQLARRRGAFRVIVSDPDPARLEAARFTGADRYVNPGSEDPAAAVREINGGRLADQVMVATGAGIAQEQSLQLVDKRGTVNFFGGLPKGQTVNLDTNLIHYGELRVVGTHGSAPSHNAQALALLAGGSIPGRPYLSAVFPLADIGSALAAAEARQGLKVIVRPTES
ncbi:MAG TPA: zinc-dependent dehydrogenase [bacterium]|nr:zinc-dependent dehydrogenase [bacterium]HNS47907.1 zinc-dependent dehydrogenase [bacterium]